MGLLLRGSLLIPFVRVVALSKERRFLRGRFSCRLGRLFKADLALKRRIDRSWLRQIVGKFKFGHGGSQLHKGKVLLSLTAVEKKLP